ncbi:ArnT family glycosyltransferase [Hoeflea sp.]|uniref:ArnT family glycosyltransferase n=1 Tax=Hoeflea sp. TaxID=1940281 RepID=UPI003B01945A
MTNSPVAGASTPDRSLLPVVWCLLALIAAAMLASALAGQSYNYPHAWVSAHFATIGRSFAETGYAALGFVPVQNNAPLTSSPDVYLNWPPLYGMVVGAVFRIFGESETTQHLLALALNFGSAALIYAIIRLSGTRLAAALGCVAFLTAPVIMRYGAVGSQLHLAIFFTLASLYAYLQATGPQQSSRLKWSVLGAVLFGLAAMSSWEPVLAAPVLFAVGLIARDRFAILLSVLFGIAGAVVVAGIFILYGMQVPYFADAILERLRLRSGMAADYDAQGAAIFSSPHFLQEKAETKGVIGWRYLPRVFLERPLLAGPLGLAGLAGTLVFLRTCAHGRARGVLVPVAAFVGIYVLWAALMPNHMMIHDYQVLFLAPAGALAFGLLIDTAPRIWTALDEPQEGPGRRQRLVLGILAVAFVLAAADRLQWLRADRTGDDRLVEFARSIGDAAPQCSVVTVPYRSMVPVYYADRHVIRAVSDEKTLAQNRAAIEALCPHCPVYAAVPEGYRSRFGTLLADTRTTIPLRHGVLVPLKSATQPGRC